jgi:hypothetical protein
LLGRQLEERRGVELLAAVVPVGLDQVLASDRRIVLGARVVWLRPVVAVDPVATTVGYRRGRRAGVVALG